MAKRSDGAQKDTGKAQKDTGKGQKVTGVEQKVTGTPPKVTGKERKNPLSSVQFSRVFGKSAPEVSPIALSAPSRTGRTVENLNAVLDSAEVRLKLAWDNREALDVALPKSPPFHQQAWTALWILRDKPKGPEDPAGGVSSEEADIERSAGRALQSLLEELALLRAAVKYVTRADDPARETLKFGTVLRATSSLIEIAPEVLKGARELQERFPALTEDAIQEAEVALHKAEKAVQRARSESISGTLARIGGADIRQLALDVLVDSLDYLRAAARTTLARSRPKLAAALTAPIEKTRERSDGPETSEPAVPVEDKAPGGGAEGPSPESPAAVEEKGAKKPRKVRRRTR